MPDDVVLHHDDVGAIDRAWVGPVPVTTPRRTLVDCARAAVAPDVLRQAARQALARQLVGRADLVDVVRALEPFGGLDA